MMLNKLTIISGLLATMANANAIPVNVELGLNVVSKFPAEGGMITVYGDRGTSNSETAHSLQARECAGSGHACGNGHFTNPEACNNLVSQIKKDHGGLSAKGDRAICWNSGSNRCCVSWNFGIDAASAKDLITPIQELMMECKHSVNEISGRRWGDTVGGRCPVICLSDRPTGCS